MKFAWMKWTALPLGLLLAGSVALAQSSTPSNPPAQTKPDPTIAQRKENQQDRIANGVQSGQLTAGETANLENQQRAINLESLADRQANGGKLTPAERQQVNREQNQASKNIYKDKHNAAKLGKAGKKS